MSLWLTETVRRSIDEAADVVSQIAAGHFKSLISSSQEAAKSESPIEAAFWTWWCAAGLGLHLTKSSRQWPNLLPQVSVTAGGNIYRLDFVVEGRKLAIELDGHDFHERTKQQVEHRNKRDRDLQAAGWVVLHFSGSTFLRAPFDCLEEIERHIIAIDAQMGDR